MDKEGKEIEYLNSHINRLWTSMIVLIGGLSGILFSFSGNETAFKSSIKGVLFVTGAYFLTLVIKGIMSVDKKINDKLKWGIDV